MITALICHQEGLNQGTDISSWCSDWADKDYEKNINKLLVIWKGLFAFDYLELGFTGNRIYFKIAQLA